MIVSGLILLSGCASVPVSKQAVLTPTASPTPIVVEARGMTLIAGGDVLPGYFLDPYFAKHNYDYPYTQIAPYFKTADIGLVNLECPLSDRGKRYKKKKYTFRGNTQSAHALKRNGMNVVALGNNHIMDYGKNALIDTLAALDDADILYSGAGLNRKEARKPAYFKIKNGPTIAFLSYSLTYPSQFWATAKKPGTALARFPIVEADITSAAAQSDFVVVSYHWGGELKKYPKGYQKDYAYASIHAGADLIVGTHPHVLQGLEYYQDKLIIYSLGNLAFGGGRSKRAVDSALIKVSCDNKGNSLQAWVLPLSVDNLDTKFVPTPLFNKEGKRILHHLERISKQWKTELKFQKDGWAKVLPPTIEAVGNSLQATTLPANKTSNPSKTNPIKK